MNKTVITLAFFTIATIIAVFGQEEKKSKIFVDTGTDVVSSYIWRGIYQTGISVQPALDISAYGITLGVWGSTDFSTPAKEIDFTLSYEISGFSVSVADYWWSGEGVSYFNTDSAGLSGHYLEVGLSYTLPDKFPLTLGVSTMLLGDYDRRLDYGNEKGGKYQNYSTYISASYPFSVNDIDCEIGIGVTPFKGMYSKSNDIDVAVISAKASKNLQITEKFALPLFVELIFSPAQDNAYFVVGVSF